MKPIEPRRWYDVSVPWLPGSILAIMLWPLCLYQGGNVNAPCLRLHEHYHRAQAQRWGVVPWYMAYLMVGIRYIGKPVDQHPMEREAYRLQRECEA